MDLIKTIFPYSFGPKDGKALAYKIVAYLLVSVIIGALCAVISLVPLLGPILAWAIGSVTGVYVLVGIVFLLLDYLKVLD